MTSEINLYALDVFLKIFDASLGWIQTLQFRIPIHSFYHFVFTKMLNSLQVLNNLFAPIKQRVANGDFIAPGTYAIQLFICY
jgi:hypothetical protein